MPRNGKPGHHGPRTQAEESRPGDEAHGQWPRERLMRMDADFCERMQRAIRAGKERPPEGEAPERAA